MNFGDILDEWDRRKQAEAGDRRSRDEGSAAALRAWLDEKGVDDKDARLGEEEARARDSRRLSSLKPQATLDLHGMTAEAAEAAISAFLEASSRSGLEKVLVIHGKGLHSENGRSVLKKTARLALEAHPLAGRIGEASRSEGGSGALWVLIKRRER